jgi:hypothetical protein
MYEEKRLLSQLSTVFTVTSQQSVSTLHPKIQKVLSFPTGESPFELKDLSPGDHRVVVVPSGPECDPSNTKAASVRFTVTKL